MYKNACRFMQRSGLHVRLYEADRSLSIDSRSERLSGLYSHESSQKSSETVKTNGNTAILEAMRRAGVSGN